MSETVSKSKITNLYAHNLAVNESPAGVINCTPIAGSRSHFRSRSFNSFISCNSLMAAANVLLSMNEQLKELTYHDNLQQLHDDLTHEIRAFESNAQNRGYNTETILIARYVICATLDETIIYGRLPDSSFWQRFKLINTFQKEQTADERLFLILERLLTTPGQHIELLELIYACLSLGFEGKYRHEHKGYQQLAEIKDNLFQQIRLVRQDPPKLFEPNQTEEKAEVSKKVSLWKVLFTTLAVTVGFILCIYFSLGFVFNKVSAPVQQQISALLKNSQHS